MNKLSIVILTLNSQKYLKEVLESAKFADEILIIDSGSTDKTKEFCYKFNTKFIYQPWLGFGKQKRFGVNLAQNEWVFVLDSDEIITQKLKDEILKTIKNPKFMAYKVARLNFFFGKAIKKMGLYPDYSVRLFNKNFANFNQRDVHESVVFFDENMAFGTLKNHFIHKAYENIDEFIAKQNRYSTLGAKKNVLKAIFSPCWTFFKLYILKGGFMEGWHGFVISKLYSQYTFWKYIK
ncbi:glycosyltransferase family 2 protein [Campylobacter corcagiensis]|uniref:Glycosyltransferase family 2 protein n=1 Tax=Campylobacter corcagiensis TaxID=1448857 RepID=A0A7M1LH02_9BACT|nr:glycosyltransferase family 2 protein [Campylobacter corcagiensis]QKF65076.1 glycosyltransferase, family 2 [Campylobacter corcagiensis]QOQ86775.1 glycosyltransferase family 2 protein [Campylobacter corcagiensis]